MVSSGISLQVGACFSCVSLNIYFSEIAKATGIEHEDVLQTLNRLEMLSFDDDSYFFDFIIFNRINIIFFKGLVKRIRH